MSILIKQDFNLVSGLHNLQLPPYLKEQLWRSGIIRNGAAMNVLSGVVAAFQPCGEDLHVLTGDFIAAVKKTEAYADYFFAYRGGRVPDEVYYAVLGKSFFPENPESFTFPAACAEIFSQTDRLFSDPGLYSSASIAGPAKYAYSMLCLLGMQDFYDRLRCGRTVIGRQGFTQNYEECVLGIKRTIKDNDSFSEALRKATRNIDFLINNITEERCWYILFATRHGEKISDKNFIFEQGGLPDAGRIRENFFLAYQQCENEAGGESYDAFYNFAEKVIVPINVLGCKQVITENELLYALSRLSRFDLGRGEAIDYASRFSVSAEFAEKVELAACLVEFEHKTITLWGDRVDPVIQIYELEEFADDLRFIDSLKIDAPNLRDYFLSCRDQACAYYNITAEINCSLGFSPYVPDSPRP